MPLLSTTKEILLTLVIVVVDANCQVPDELSANKKWLLGPPVYAMYTASPCVATAEASPNTDPSSISQI